MQSNKSLSWLLVLVGVQGSSLLWLDHGVSVVLVLCRRDRCLGRGGKGSVGREVWGDCGGGLSLSGISHRWASLAE